MNEKKYSIGSWITMDCHESTEVMLQHGFDWICIDLEHSTISLDSMKSLISLCEKYKVKSYIRIAEINKAKINKILDAGASGLIVANIKNAKDVQKCLDYAFYHPIGNRGMGLSRAQGYGKKFDQYVKKDSKEIEIIPIIESEEAINNLEDILSLQEVQLSMIGPYDLSSSLGKPGDFQSKSFKSALKRYKEVSNNLNKGLGIHVVEPSKKDLLKAVKENYSFIAFSTDTIILDRALSSALESI